VIELLLQAEQALAVGLLDQAERLYAQAVAADPRNSIAVVGLARVALERADDGEAYRLAREALAIDPENVAAARVAGRLEEIYASRGLPVPAPGGAAEKAAVTTAPARVPEPSAPPPPPSAPAPSSPSAAAPAERSLIDRMLRRNRS